MIPQQERTYHTLVVDIIQIMRTWLRDLASRLESAFAPRQPVGQPKISQASAAGIARSMTPSQSLPEASYRAASGLD